MRLKSRSAGTWGVANLEWLKILFNGNFPRFIVICTEVSFRFRHVVTTTNTSQMLPGRFITRLRLKPSSHILDEAYSLYQLAEIDLIACNFQKRL
ncbi:hypothetical protein, partial [Nostoc sp. 'Peltigera malacea cyanobiont' DB3992]|uniref:hypothetical protein n=1 Tax=Nostoc sp. 'Peltigera malacea cyanobiont' DB3992 TaxID=1206980 RepID=UPI00211E1F5B